MKGVIIKYFYPRALKSCYLFIYICIFKTPAFEIGRYCFVFNFWFSWPNELFLYFFNSSVISVGTLNHHWEINYFWNSKGFKNSNFTLFKNYNFLHILKTFWIFNIVFKKFFSSYLVLLYEECAPVILMVSLHKSTHFIPQTATLTLFTTPIPAISHFS